MRNQVYNRLRELGFNPNTIIDCGACVGEWSGQIKQVYPESFIMGIDASNWSNGNIPSTNISEFEVLSNEDNKEKQILKIKELKEAITTLIEII